MRFDGKKNIRLRTSNRNPEGGDIFFNGAVGYQALGQA
jgi:hypothetical protein